MLSVDGERPDLRRALHSWLGSVPALPAGLLGSVVVAAGGLFMGRLAATPGVHALVVLQAGHRARPIGFVLVFSGLTLLTIAWLSLGVRVHGADDGVRRVWFATLLWAAPLMVTPPLFSNDVWSYVADGDLVATGRSPYVFTPLDLAGPIVHAVSGAWVGRVTPYGPLPLIWGGLVSHISMNPWFGLLGFRVLAVAGLVALAVCVPAIARRTGRDPATAAWLVLASPFTLAHGIAGAHLDLVMVGLLTVAVLAALQGRWVTAAIVVGAATAVKAPAATVAVAVVLASLPHVPVGIRGLRARLGRSVQVLGLTAGTVLVLGLVSGLGLGWVHGLTTPLSHNSALSLTSEVGVHLGALLGLRLMAQASLVGALLLVAVVAGVVLRAPSRGAADVLLAAAAVMSAEVLLSPVVHYWYFFWCLPFLGSVGMARRFARATVAMALVLGLLAPVDQSLHHLPHSVTVMLLGVCGALLTLIEPRDVRRLAGRRTTSTTS